MFTIQRNKMSSRKYRKLLKILSGIFLVFLGQFKKMSDMEDCYQGKIPSGLDFVNFSLTVLLINVKSRRFRHLRLQITFGGKLSRFLTCCFPTVAAGAGGMLYPGGAQVPLELPLQLYEDVRVTVWNVTETGELSSTLIYIFILFLVLVQYYFIVVDSNCLDCDINQY